MSRGYSLREPFEAIPRRVLQPPPLVMSARALGVLVHLLSMPDGWVSSAEKLSAVFKEGRDAIETALGELEKVGFLARHRIQGERGRWGWVWIYGDDPEFVQEHLAAKLAEVRAEVAVEVGSHEGDSAGRTETGNPGIGEGAA